MLQKTGSAETICPGWSVKDIAGHLLGDDLGLLSRGRDDYASPSFATGLDISTLSGLIAAIDRQNALWVETMRRLSPRVLMELLQVSGTLTEAYFASLDLAALGGPVDWAGPGPAPVWLHVAREYTERWVHQQHIRDAVGRPGLNERRWLGPVLETFVRGLSRALASEIATRWNNIAAGHHRRRRRRICCPAAAWHLGVGYRSGDRRRCHC